MIKADNVFWKNNHILAAASGFGAIGWDDFHSVRDELSLPLRHQLALVERPREEIPGRGVRALSRAAEGRSRNVER